MEKNREKTIPEMIEEIIAEICDKYCKWPNICEYEDELYEKHCKDCPTMKL